MTILEALHFRAAAAVIAVVGVVAASSPAFAAPPPPDLGVVSSTWSSDDGTYRLTERPSLALQSSTTSDAGVDVSISVDPAAQYQQVLGQGQSLESSSVANLAALSEPVRDRVMRELFSPDIGNGYTLVRLSLGCSDFCSGPFYTYNDLPQGQTDEALRAFSIQRDIDSGIIAVARQAREINPDVRFYLSMWSAPAWMKTNGSLINGGTVKPEYYGVLARYQRMAIEAYEAQGIPITALTPQNEPRVVTNYPTGEWTGEQMRDYIASSLGPELDRAGLDTEIWVGDDNPPRLQDFVPPILDDPTAARYVDGVAIHDYSGDSPSVLSAFALRYPGYPLHLTERSYYGVNGEANRFDGNIQAGVNRVVQFFRNGLTSWTSWLSFLDTDGEPNTGPLRGDCCALPLTAPPGDLDSVTTTRDYYLYGQFSRYIHRGATRVGSSQTSPDVANVAFVNSDGTVVVIVANAADAPRTLRITSPDGTVQDTLAPRTVGTYRWTSTTEQVNALLGTFVLQNRAYPDLAVHATQDVYAGNPDALEAVAAPTSWRTIEQRWAITSAGGGYYRLSSVSSQDRTLHTTGERYGDWPDVYRVAVVDSSLQWDEQLWRIEPAGDGYYRFVNKSRSTALQVAGEMYGGWPDVQTLVSSPAAWDIPEQHFRLLPGGVGG